MNIPLAASSADGAELKGASTAAPALSPGRTLITLVRREFWEHRALWYAPLGTAILMALCATFAQVPDPADLHWGHGGSPTVAMFTITQFVLAVPLYVVLVTVVTFYLLDCLYAERKDRSILFWKSLPVSDALTVSAKLLTGLVVVPLATFGLALLSYLGFFILWQARVRFGHAPDALTWDTLVWLRVEVTMFLVLILAMLWYAPVAALLQLSSVLLRRSPVMWVTLAMIFLPLLERIVLGTRYLFDFMQYRTFGIWGVLVGDHHEVINKDNLLPIDGWLMKLNYAGAFTSPGLWLGVVVAVLFVLLSVRIRRYRDDT